MDSTMSTGESCRVMGEGGAVSFPKSTTISTVSGVLSIVLAAPGHQMINLRSVVSFVPIRDESKEVGVVCELQELDGLVAGGAAVGVQ